MDFFPLIQDFKNHTAAENQNKLESLPLFSLELNPRLELMVTKEGQPSHPTFLLVCMSHLAYRRVWSTFFFETLNVCIILSLPSRPSLYLQGLDHVIKH